MTLDIRLSQAQIEIVIKVLDGKRKDLERGLLGIKERGYPVAGDASKIHMLEGLLSPIEPILESIKQQLEAHLNVDYIGCVRCRSSGDCKVCLGDGCAACGSGKCENCGGTGQVRVTFDDFEQQTGPT